MPDDKIVPFRSDQKPVERPTGLMTPDDVYSLARESGMAKVVVLGRDVGDGLGFRLMSNVNDIADLVLLLEQAKLALLETKAG